MDLIAEFDDKTHPLKVTNTDLTDQEKAAIYRQITVRIKERCKERIDSDQVYGKFTIRLGREDDPVTTTERRATQESIARQWGKGQSYVSERLNKPYMMVPYEYETLCRMLDVSEDWLKSGDGENLGYHAYESAVVIADLYERMNQRDKQVISDIMRRYAGPERVRAARDRERMAYDSEHFTRHLESYKKRSEDIHEAFSTVSSIIESGVFSTVPSIVESGEIVESENE